MELLFVVLLSASASLGVRYLVPGRETYGSALLPAIGGAVSAIVWAALTWLAWPYDGGWIWVVSLFVGPLVCVAVAILIPRRRRKVDAVLLDSLSKA